MPLFATVERIARIFGASLKSFLPLDQSAGDEFTQQGNFGLRSQRCDRVRVMPFLEGIPCSIHGIVFADDVAVFRPVEMIVLRKPGSSEFQYAGCATYWDPPGADRGALRALARAVGEHLRETLDYRGAFTIDGVLTTDGFRPTELNPRSGAGLGTMGRSIPDLPLSLLDTSVRAGDDLGIDARALESVLLTAADATRSGGGWSIVPSVHPTETTTYRLVRDDGEFRVAANDTEIADATVELGPSPGGGFLRFIPDPARTPVGDSMAPLVVAAYAWADRELGTDFGTLEPAPDVRHG